MKKKQTIRRIIRNISSGSCFLALLILFAISTARAQNGGDIDPGFGDAGRVIENLGQSYELAYGAVVQPDGKIITVGDLWTGLNDYVFVARHNADGTLDSTFATNGFAQFGSDTTDLLPTGGGALQADGKILVAGLALVHNGLRGFMLRLLPDGTPDPGFGNNGLVVYNTGTTSRFYAVAAAPGGRILAAGSVSTGAGSNSAVVRFLNDGSLDPDFGDNGLAEVAVNTFTTDIFYSLAFFPNGDILATGASNIVGTGVAVRLTSNGSPAAGFGTNGIAEIEVPDHTIFFYGSAVQPDGKVLLGGYRSKVPNRDVMVTRLLSDGTPDAGFGSAGTAFTDVGVSDILRALTLLPDGKILGAGYQASTGGPAQALLLRYTAAGNLDASFGDNGIVTDFSDTEVSRFYALALRSNGNLLAAGHRQNARNHYDLALAGFQANGSADPAFGITDDGWQSDNLASADNVVNAVLPGENGHIIVVGSTPVAVEFNVSQYSSEGTRLSFDSLDAMSNIQNVMPIDGGGFMVHGISFDTCIVWKFKTDGTLDGAFGDLGILRIVLPDMSSLTFVDAAMLPDGKVLLCGGGIDQNNNYLNFIARVLPDGSPDMGWNGTGILELPSSIGAIGHVLCLQPDGKLLVGGRAYTDNKFFLARYEINGATDAGFGINGIQLQEAGGPDEVVRDIVLDPVGRIVVAVLVTSSVDVLQNVVLRFSPSGFLESGFGDGGAVIFPIGSGINNYYEPKFEYSLGVQADSKILLSSFADNDMVLYRLLPNGTSDSDFGINGAVKTDIFGKVDIPGHLLVQPDNKILQSGMAYNGADYDAVLLRFLPGLVVGTEDLTPDGSLWLIYPNPVRESATLRFQNPVEGNVTIQLETTGGQVLQTLFNAPRTAGEQTLELRMNSNLPAGAYVCRVVTPGGQVAIRLFRL